jgi:hypothetical protein
MANALEVDNIHVAGNPADRSVTVSFGDVELQVRISHARELAFALMNEAARAEDQHGPEPCPTCGEFGCPELHGEGE